MRSKTKILKEKIKQLEKEKSLLQHKLSLECFKNENYQIFKKYTAGTYITSDIIIVDIEVKDNSKELAKFFVFSFHNAFLKHFGAISESCSLSEISIIPPRFYVNVICFDYKSKQLIDLTLDEVKKLENI